MQTLEEIKLIIWLMIVGLISGTAGIVSKQKLSDCKNLTCKCIRLITGIVASMLMAYLAFTVCFFYTDRQHMSVAIAGVFAWMGTDAILFLQNIIKEYLQKRVKNG